MDNVSRKFWETVYWQHIGKMIAICYRYTQNKQVAEDLAHQALVIAIEKYSGFENRGPFEAWLRRIVVNTALQYLRDKKKQQILEKYIVHCGAFCEEPEISATSERTVLSKAELLKAIDLLPDHHRVVFNLYVVDNFTHAEIGQQLGISEGTSKSHLARARKKIRKILADHLRENKQSGKAFLLLIVPASNRYLDSIFSKTMNDLAIQPGDIHSFNPTGFNEATVPVNPSPVTFYKPLSKIGIPAKIIAASVIIASLIYFDGGQNSTQDAGKTEADVLPALAVRADNALFFDSATATIADNVVIPDIKNKKSEKMKTFIPISALLIAGLAFDTATPSPKMSLQAAQHELAGISVAKHTTVIPDSLPARKSKSVRLHGTFYASKITWSEAGKKIYVTGKQVKVDLNTQHFTGSGEFSFINNVSYLVVDGAAMKLNETVKLTDKKYTFTQLTEEETIKKYGDKLVAVEMSQAE